MSLPRLRHFFACSFVTLLAACGGGGDETPVGPVLQGPPTSAASLAQSSDDAARGVEAAVGAGTTIAAVNDEPDALFSPVGAAFGAQPGSTALWRRGALGSGREQAMAVSQVACSDLFPPPCSGSVSLDTNWNGSSDIVPADSYVAFNFDALSFSAEGHAYSLHGGLRVDYLSAFDTTVVVPANVRFQLTSSNLGGSVDGTVYAPKSRITLFEFDSVGGLTLTTEGRSFSGLSQVSIADANNYSIGTAIVRSAHWSNRNAHVTTTFQDWSVSNGRPLAGSQVTVSGAGGNSIAIEVTASSSSSVVYDVQLSIDGVAKRYTVTAAYPVGGGAATYAAIAISE